MTQPMSEDTLWVRDVPVLDAAELATLRDALGDELEASATLRAWLGGAPVQPHSVAVAVETQLRMLFGESPDAATLLGTVIERLAEAFPDEVQPLDTT